MSRDNRRVLWYEGMTLDPHHFQQWDRYHGDVLSARIRSLRHHDWGLTTLEIDRDRLANGEFSLISCSGVLSGGLPFSIPEDADPPPIRNVADHFPANADHVSVFLSVPAIRSDGINVELHEADSIRPATIVSRTVTVTDENTGSDERAIQVGQANFQVRFGTESSEAFTNHQIAVVRRGAGGFFALDDRFIPTCLSIEASDRLLSISRRLLELAVAKSSSLSERKMGATGQRQLTPADITALGLLASVNAHIPLLNHHYAMKTGHPEDFYLTMLSLAGQLTTYVGDARTSPRNLPIYSHSNPSSCFNELDTVLEELLGGAQPATNYVRLPLNEIGENLYKADVDAELLETAQLILSAKSAEISESRLVAELPSMLRIAAPEIINNVLRSYTRALTVEHTTRLPVGAPEDPQSSYFVVKKQGPFWDGIKESGSMAVFVPAEFDAVTLTLIAVP